jgi:hypothetical protein
MVFIVVAAVPAAGVVASAEAAASGGQFAPAHLWLSAAAATAAAVLLSAMWAGSVTSFDKAAWCSFLSKPVLLLTCLLLLLQHVQCRLAA